MIKNLCACHQFLSHHHMCMAEGSKLDPVAHIGTGLGCRWPDGGV